MSLTIQETVQQIEESLHEKAVWDYTVDSLKKFISTDYRDAVDGIRAERCVEKIVPQETIQAVIDFIEAEHIVPLEEAIKGLENLQVVETKDVTEKEDPKKAQRGKGKPAVAQANQNKKGRGPVPPKSGATVRQIG